MAESEHYIDTGSGLRDFIGEFRGHDVIALDTEFLRERTYYPRLCLIQVAYGDALACIDPLAISELDPLLDLLYDDTVTKVVHSGRQDFEILHRLRGDLPRPVFDTQLAATLLGLGDQVSYAALVESTLGIALNKGHTRTDWCHRPLESGQIEYALDDVRHLPDLYRHQLGELGRLGRLEWLEEDFAALTDPAEYENEPDQAWRRVKGVNKLRGVQRAVLRRLAAWREREAKRSDRPRRWVVRDEALPAVAQRLPGSGRDLNRIRGLEAKAIARYGADLLGAVRAGMDEPQEKWPHAPAHLRLSAEQDALVDAAMAVLRMQGHVNGVSPQSLAARRDLERLVAGERDIPLLRGWRYALAGRKVVEFLEGRTTLTVANGELEILGGRPLID